MRYHIIIVIDAIPGLYGRLFLITFFCEVNEFMNNNNDNGRRPLYYYYILALVVLMFLNTSVFPSMFKTKVTDL